MIITSSSRALSKQISMTSNYKSENPRTRRRLLNFMIQYKKTSNKGKTYGEKKQQQTTP